MIVKVETSRDDGKTFVFHIGFNSAWATGADYVKFLGDVNELLLTDTAAMERLANAEGRTTLHPLYGAVGSIAINPE